MSTPPQRDQVFFSYSHKDKKWLERFQAALKPLVRGNQLSVWDDTRIKAGDIWRDEIKQALASAKVAVLLVSINFLESDFIDKHELPPLLEAAQKEGLRILLIVIGPSLFDETDLGRYQAVNDPSRPLASISAASREKEIVRICREIKAAVTSSPAVSPAINKQKDEMAGGQPTHLTIDLQALDDSIHEISPIPYEYKVQEIINEIVKFFNLPRADGNNSITYSLVSKSGVLSNFETLPEAGVKSGDLIRLVSSHQPTVYPDSAHLHNLG
jgi:hypothetical protein